MTGRYITVAVITLLATAWVVAAAYGYLHLSAATDLAGSVSRGTAAFQQELEQPRVEILNQRSFPENAVVNAVKAAWGGGIKVSAYPPEVLYSPAAPSARPRNR
jgi:elongation factor P hydroxylase